MVPDLISTLIAIVLVCVAVLDRPALDSQHVLLVIAGVGLGVLGTIANRVDYLKWPGLYRHRGRRPRDGSADRLWNLVRILGGVVLDCVLVRQHRGTDVAVVGILSRPARLDRDERSLVTDLA